MRPKRYNMSNCVKDFQKDKNLFKVQNLGLQRLQPLFPISFAVSNYQAATTSSQRNTILAACISVKRVTWSFRSSITSERLGFPKMSSARLSTEASGRHETLLFLGFLQKTHACNQTKSKVHKVLYVLPSGVACCPLKEYHSKPGGEALEIFSACFAHATFISARGWAPQSLPHDSCRSASGDQICTENSAD